MNPIVPYESSNSSDSSTDSADQYIISSTTHSNDEDDYTESSVYSRRMHEPSSEHEPNSTTSQPIITSTVVSEATPPLVITMDRPRSSVISAANSSSSNVTRIPLRSVARSGTAFIGGINPTSSPIGSNVARILPGIFDETGARVAFPSSTAVISSHSIPITTSPIVAAAIPATVTPAAATGGISRRNSFNLERCSTVVSARLTNVEYSTCDPNTVRPLVLSATTNVIPASKNPHGSDKASRNSSKQHVQLRSIRPAISSQPSSVAKSTNPPSQSQPHLTMATVSTIVPVSSSVMMRTQQPPTVRKVPQTTSLRTIVPAPEILCGKPFSGIFSTLNTPSVIRQVPPVVRDAETPAYIQHIMAQHSMSAQPQLEQQQQQQQLQPPERDDDDVVMEEESEDAFDGHELIEEIITEEEDDQPIILQSIHGFSSRSGLQSSASSTSSSSRREIHAPINRANLIEVTSSPQSSSMETVEYEITDVSMSSGNVIEQVISYDDASDIPIITYSSSPEIEEISVIPLTPTVITVPPPSAISAATRTTPTVISVPPASVMLSQQQQQEYYHHHQQQQMKEKKKRHSKTSPATVLPGSKAKSTPTAEKQEDGGGGGNINEVAELARYVDEVVIIDDSSQSKPDSNPQPRPPKKPRKQQLARKDKSSSSLKDIEIISRTNKPIEIDETVETSPVVVVVADAAEECPPKIKKSKKSKKSKSKRKDNEPNNRDADGNANGGINGQNKEAAADDEIYDGLPAVIVELLKKRRRFSIMSHYTPPAKVRSNHFERYEDVKVKETKRPSLHDVANGKNIPKMISGWKIYELAEEIEDLRGDESERSLEITGVINVFGSVVLTEDNTRDVVFFKNLLQGNVLRSDKISEQFSVSKLDLLQLMNHKRHVKGMLSKFTGKRCKKRKHR